MSATNWDELPLMLTPKQVRIVLPQYGEERIRELCRDRRMPHVRLGRAFAIPRDSLRRWLEREADAAVEEGVYFGG